MTESQDFTTIGEIMKTEEERRYRISCQRVARGAAWLDANHSGWERKIDLSILDLTNDRECVCGQVIPKGIYQSGYDRVISTRLIPLDQVADHGFLYSYDQDQWVTLIKERFDSGALSDA